MAEFESIGEPKIIDLPSGRFIEIGRKKVVGKDTELISISKGEYYLDKDKKPQKRYQKNFSFGTGNGTTDAVIKALGEV